MLSALLSVIALAAAAAAAGGYCPDDWLQVGDSCYTVSENTTSWSSVAAACADLDADSQPASVHSLQQNTALASLLAGAPAWLGLARNSSADQPFAWSDGSPLDYTFWTNCQPSTYGDCALLNVNAVTGQWDAAPCGDQRRYLCQRPADRCPPGWQLYSGRCFFYNTTYIYDDEQYNACRAMRIEAAPASIHDMDTNRFVASLLKDDSSAWLGLRRTGPVPEPDHLGTRIGDWHWLDGSKNLFTNWYLSPRNSDLYARIEKRNAGAWRSFEAGDSVDAFICQITLQ